MALSDLSWVVIVSTFHTRNMRHQPGWGQRRNADQVEARTEDNKQSRSTRTKRDTDLARAEYWGQKPDLVKARVGEQNRPETAMIQWRMGTKFKLTLSFSLRLTLGGDAPLFKEGGTVIESHVPHWLSQFYPARQTVNFSLIQSVGVDLTFLLLLLWVPYYLCNYFKLFHRCGHSQN